jgi:hypothetical protein
MMDDGLAQKQKLMKLFHANGAILFLFVKYIKRIMMEYGEKGGSGGEICNTVNTLIPDEEGKGMKLLSMCGVS